MKTYLRAFLILLAVVLANYIGQELGFAYTVPFYDVYLHIFGGFGIVFLLEAMVASYSPGYERTKSGKWLIIFGALAVGLIWEWLEAYLDVTGDPLGSFGYYLDTIKDVVDDMIGAVAALSITKRFWKKPTEGTV